MAIGSPGEVRMSEARLIERIRGREARICVIGQGYVGLPLAVEFARAGFVVAGLDNDPARVAALSAGQSHSPDVPEGDLAAVLRAHRYEPTSDFSVLPQCDVVIICVPTPLGKSKDPDISFVMVAAEQVAARFRPGQLVILESTTYPGTTEELLLPLFEARFIHVADQINRAIPDYVVELVGDALNETHRCLNGAKILALGVAYKRDVGDTRESPALEILARLRQKGTDVSYADPHVPSVSLGGIVLKAVEPTDEDLATADCVLILTDHRKFDYRRIVEIARLVVDTRNATGGIPAAPRRVVRLWKAPGNS